jgi:hypothetical protein
MHSQRILLLVVAVVGLLSAFLPWFTIMIMGVTGMDIGQGWVVLAIFGAAIAASVAGNRRMPLAAAPRGVIALLGAGAAGFGIWKLVEIKNGDVRLGGELGDIGKLGAGRVDGLFKGMFDVGFGLYLLIGAGALLAILAILRRKSALMPG